MVCTLESKSTYTWDDKISFICYAHQAWLVELLEGYAE